MAPDRDFGNVGIFRGERYFIAATAPPSEVVATAQELLD
jgi:hypothetical protein